MSTRPSGSSDKSPSSGPMRVQSTGSILRPSPSSGVAHPFLVPGGSAVSEGALIGKHQDEDPISETSARARDLSRTRVRKLHERMHQASLLDDETTSSSNSIDVRTLGIYEQRYAMQYLRLPISQLRTLLEKNLFPGFRLSILVKVKKLDAHRRRAPQDNHMLCVASKKDRRPRLQRITFLDGTFIVSGTWRLKDVKQVEYYDTGSMPGFTLFCDKKYYYACHSLEERNDFLLKLFMKYQQVYDGRLPTTSIDLLELRLASNIPEEQTMADITQSYRKLMSENEESSLEALLGSAASDSGVPDFIQLARDLEKQQNALAQKSTHALIGAETQLERVGGSLVMMGDYLEQTALWLNTYDAQLSFMRRYIGQVEARSALLHAFQRNQSRMLACLENMISDLHVEERHLQTLSFGSLRPRQGDISHIYEAAQAVQKALNSTAAISTKLRQLRAVRERVAELEKVRATFASRLLRYLLRIIDQLQRRARDGSLPLPLGSRLTTSRKARKNAVANAVAARRRQSMNVASAEEMSDLEEDEGLEKEDMTSSTAYHSSEGATVALSLSTKKSHEKVTETGNKSGHKMSHPTVNPAHADAISIRRLVHDDVFAELELYAPLVRWLGKADVRLHGRLRRGYASAMQRRYQWEVRNFIRALQGLAHKGAKVHAPMVVPGDELASSHETEEGGKRDSGSGSATMNSSSSSTSAKLGMPWCSLSHGMLVERVRPEYAFGFGMRALALAMLAERKHWSSIFALPLGGESKEEEEAGKNGEHLSVFSKAQSGEKKSPRLSSKSWLVVDQLVGKKSQERKAKGKFSLYELEEASGEQEEEESLEEKADDSEDEDDLSAEHESEAVIVNAELEAEYAEAAAHLHGELATWLGKGLQEACEGLRALVESTAKADPLALILVLADTSPYLDSGLPPLLTLTTQLQQRGMQLLNLHLDTHAAQLAHIPKPLKHTGVLAPIEALPALLDQLAAKAHQHEHSRATLRTVFQKLLHAAFAGLSRLDGGERGTTAKAGHSNSSSGGGGGGVTTPPSPRSLASREGVMTSEKEASVAQKKEKREFLLGSSEISQLKHDEEKLLLVKKATTTLSKEEELACVVRLENYRFLVENLRARCYLANHEFTTTAQRQYERAAQEWAGHLAREMAPSAWSFFALLEELLPRLRTPTDAVLHASTATEALERNVLSPLRASVLRKQLARLFKHVRKALTLHDLLLRSLWGRVLEIFAVVYKRWKTLVEMCFEKKFQLPLSIAEILEIANLPLLEYAAKMERKAAKKDKKNRHKDSSQLLSPVPSVSPNQLDTPSPSKVEEENVKESKSHKKKKKKGSSISESSSKSSRLKKRSSRLIPSRSKSSSKSSSKSNK